jgi:hypothetical protein
MEIHANLHLKKVEFDQKEESFLFHTNLPYKNLFQNLMVLHPHHQQTNPKNFLQS